MEIFIKKKKGIVVASTLIMLLVGLIILFGFGVLGWTKPFKVVDPADPHFNVHSFRFEDYQGRDVLHNALQKILKPGMSMREVDKILVDSGGAKKSFLGEAINFEEAIPPSEIIRQFKPGMSDEEKKKIWDESVITKENGERTGEQEYRYHHIPWYRSLREIWMMAPYDGESVYVYFENDNLTRFKVKKHY